MGQPKGPNVMAGIEGRGIRLILFMPMVIVVMGALMFVAVFAVTTTAAQIALVVAILAVGVAFSTAMLKRAKAQR
jgi:hypothetical protein